MVHYAAGILPVTWHEGRALFLVGQDVRDRSWSDFGGKCERVDKNDPMNTACREFYEETYGCVLDWRMLRHRMHPGNCLSLRSRTQNQHPYWMFLVQMPYRPHLRNAFHRTLQFVRYKNLCKAFVEKIDLRWVTWEVLRGAQLAKRPVFQATLEAHADLLGRVVAGERWESLCAEHACAHASSASDLGLAGRPAPPGGQCHGPAATSCHV
jgi:8-oxo-dGTP pyrophosphatase MutT (NUDIX family)